MNVRLLKTREIESLKNEIVRNLERYRTGDFQNLVVDSSLYIETKQDMNETQIRSIRTIGDDHNEVENCKTIKNAFDGLSLYLARDERMWVYLTHTLLLDYARTRWPIPDDDEKAVNHILNHFFVVGARGFERDNAASRLWWMATLCERAIDLTFEEALEAFLHASDVRANLVERPTTSQNVSVFSAILRRLHDSYLNDRLLYDRDRFRNLMKEINLRGGTKLLSAFSYNEIGDIVDECIDVIN